MAEHQSLWRVFDLMPMVRVFDLTPMVLRRSSRRGSHESHRYPFHNLRMGFSMFCQEKTSIIR
jgi:hypothetical protein